MPSALLNNDGVQVYADGSIMRMLLPSGDILRYEDEIYPLFVLNSKFYSYVYFGYYINSYIFSFIDIDANGTVVIASNSESANGDIQISDLEDCFYSSDYNNIIFRTQELYCFKDTSTYLFEMNDLVIFNGASSYLLSEKDAELGESTISTYELKDRLLIIDDSYVRYLDLVTLEITRYALPAKSTLDGVLGDVRYYLSVVDDEFYYIFNGSDYNTGEIKYGTILSDGSVEFATTREEIDALYYDREISKEIIY